MKRLPTRWANPDISDPASCQPQVASAFINLLLTQLDSRFPASGIERGGLNDHLHARF